MKKIRIAIAGLGNCASFLLQSIEYSKHNGEIVGALHPVIGGYKISDIEVVAAFDVDSRKVGKDISEACFEDNTINTEMISRLSNSGISVMRGPLMDGVGEFLKKKVIVDGTQAVDVARVLKETGADILINYLPVGSHEATRFYANEALKAGCGFINCIPEFIASNGTWADKFHRAMLPLIGDDIKGQLGASILSRALVNLFKERGCKIDRMYQLNFGGNTDFLNLLEDSRLKYKRISKTETVQSQMASRLEDENIHIGPSDYVPWLKSRKVAHIRIEGRTFGNIPIILDTRLDVEDKSVSAGVVIDSIRCCKLALERGVSGSLISPSAYFMKSPPEQFPDSLARQMVDEFIAGERER